MAHPRLTGMENHWIGNPPPVNFLQTQRALPILAARRHWSTDSMTATMNAFHNGDDSGNDPRFMLTVLAGGMAVMLLATTEMQHAPSTPLFAGGQIPIVDNVREMRPQGPPPVFDVDQLTPEEVEQPVAATPYSGSVDSRSRDSGNLRARPER